MIVIADTSPINYLILIEAIDILPKLFGDVIVPRAVYNELNHVKAPEDVKYFIANLPVWLRIEDVDLPSDTGFDDLDYGEREAIYLAEQIKADLLLIDEKKGFKVARERELNAVGTLFILEQAAKRKIIDLAEAFEKLRKTSFHISPILLDEILYNQSISDND